MQKALRIEVPFALFRVPGTVYTLDRTFSDQSQVVTMSKRLPDLATT